MISLLLLSLGAMSQTQPVLGARAELVERRICSHTLLAQLHEQQLMADNDLV